MKLSSLLIVALLMGFAVMSFKSVDKGHRTENTVINQGLKNLKDRIEHLKSDVYLFKEGGISIENLQISLKNTRNSYKEVEFYIAYHYPGFAKLTLTLRRYLELKLRELRLIHFRQKVCRFLMN